MVVLALKFALVAVIRLGGAMLFLLFGEVEDALNVLLDGQCSMEDKWDKKADIYAPLFSTESNRARAS